MPTDANIQTSIFTETSVSPKNPPNTDTIPKLQTLHCNVSPNTKKQMAVG